MVAIQRRVYYNVRMGSIDLRGPWLQIDARMIERTFIGKGWWRDGRGLYQWATSWREPAYKQEMLKVSKSYDKLIDRRDSRAGARTAHARRPGLRNVSTAQAREERHNR